MNEEQWSDFRNQMKFLETCLPRIFKTLVLQRIPIDLVELMGAPYSWEPLSAEDKVKLAVTFNLPPPGITPSMSFIDLLNGLRDDKGLPTL